VKRQTAIQIADQVTASEIVFVIPKEKYEQLKSAMEKSRDSISLTFDKAGILEHAEPDIYMDKPNNV
jgi:hypothetical protein